MSARYLRISCIALALVTMSMCASAAARPVIGGLPFTGDRGTYRYVVPYAIFWELCHIPGQRVVNVGPTRECVELDRLPLPSAPDDNRAYSRLASATGVDYLVSGAIEHQNSSEIRFSIAVHSAANPQFCTKHTYECRLSALIGSAIQAAKDIASDVGTPAIEKAQFDTHPVVVKALPPFNRSIYLGDGIAEDAADYRRALRLGEEAESLSPSSPMVADWPLNWHGFTADGLDRTEKLLKHDPHNLYLLKSIIDQCFYLDHSDRALSYAKQLLAIDPTSPCAQIVVSGKADSASSRAWQSQSILAQTYSTVADVRRLRATIRDLEARHPKSAYIRYRAGYLLQDVEDYGSAVCEFEDAVRLNPCSFRLQMKLVSAYLSADQDNKALVAAERALKRWPKRSECHAVAARAYRANDQDAKAASEMRTALKLDPDASVNRAFIASQDMRSGDIASGLRALSSSGPGAKQAIIVMCVILVVMFVVLLIIIALVVRHMLRPDRKPKEQ